MAETDTATGTKPDALKTPQEVQVEQLVAELAGKLEHFGALFSELDTKLQAQFKGQADEIAKLSSSIASVQANAIKRFHAIADEHRRGGDYRGPFASREEAGQFGRVVAAIMRRDHAAMKEELEKAAISPTKGTTGGYLMPELLLGGIIRNVEDAGVFERNCPAIPVNVMSGGAVKRTAGLTVYYPDYGVAGTASTPGAGQRRFELKRFVVGTEVDNWMLASDLAVALGDWVATEISYALALAEDTNWFVGTGTNEYCGYTGLFKRTDLLSVAGVSGDDTFDEMIAKSTLYLGEMLGTAPLWVHNSSPKWFMHLLIFFKYLGVRDTAGQPIANVMQAQGGGLPFWLMGYPVEPVQVAPSATAVSTVFALFGALARACRVYRHSKAVELKSSDQLKFWEAMTVFAADVPQDMQVADTNGIVQLKTAAS